LTSFTFKKHRYIKEINQLVIDLLSFIKKQRIVI